VVIGPEHDERAAFQGGPSRHLLSGRLGADARLRHRPYDSPLDMAQSTSLMGNRGELQPRPSTTWIGRSPAALILRARQHLGEALVARAGWIR
jgi:hypothetical protein